MTIDDWQLSTRWLGRDYVMRNDRKRATNHRDANTKALSLRSAIVLAGALMGCNANPSPGDPAYKNGELGNGDFLFACEDGVACIPYSGDAKEFPEAIATGSNFDIRFVANGQQGTFININNQRYDGVTLHPVAPYVGRGPSGFTGLAPGFGTILVRDSRNTILDYVTLRFVKPDGLVVYDADYSTARGKEPPRIHEINVRAGDSVRYRAATEHQKRVVAGAIIVTWTSSDTSIIDVDSYTGGVVNLRAIAPGSTKIIATGAALSKEIPVEVSP